MKSIEEIEKLTALLEKGAITNEEFEHLSEQLTAASNEIQTNTKLSDNKESRNSVNSITDEHNRVFANNFKAVTLNMLNEIESNISSAGSNIISSVSYAVLSQVSSFITFLILMFGYLPTSFKVMMGSESIYDLTSIIVILSIFALLSFIFWVLQLSQLKGAGKKLRFQTNELSIISYNNNGKVLIPDPEQTELKGLKIGQDYAGGIIAFFDKSKLFAFIIAKDKLSERLAYGDAVNACYNFSSGGYHDWSLPSSHELILVKNKLKGDFFFNYDKGRNIYWCRGCKVLNADYGMIDSNKKPRTKASVRPIRFAAI